jgi:hypothetical protein
MKYLICYGIGIIPLLSPRRKKKKEKEKKKAGRLFIRWEKKIGNYIAMLHFACAWITYRGGGLFG